MRFRERIERGLILEESRRTRFMGRCVWVLNPGNINCCVRNLPPLSLSLEPARSLALCCCFNVYRGNTVRPNRAFQSSFPRSFAVRSAAILWRIASMSRCPQLQSATLNRNPSPALPLRAIERANISMKTPQS